MDVEVIAGARVAASSLPFSPGLRVGEWVFVSGQASVSEAGAIVGDTFEGEMRRSLENLKSVLSGAGLGLANVVQVRAYVDDPEDVPDYNRLYLEYFTQPYPARTTLTGCLGGTLKFEIDVLACAGMDSQTHAETGVDIADLGLERSLGHPKAVAQHEEGE